MGAVGQTSIPPPHLEDPTPTAVVLEQGSRAGVTNTMMRMTRNATQSSATSDVNRSESIVRRKEGGAAAAVAIRIQNNRVDTKPWFSPTTGTIESATTVRYEADTPKHLTATAMSMTTPRFFAARSATSCNHNFGGLRSVIKPPQERSMKACARKSPKGGRLRQRILTVDEG